MPMSLQVELLHRLLSLQWWNTDFGLLQGIPQGLRLQPQFRWRLLLQPSHRLRRRSARARDFRPHVIALLFLRRRLLVRRAREELLICIGFQSALRASHMQQHLGTKFLRDLHEDVAERGA